MEHTGPEPQDLTDNMPESMKFSVPWNHDPELLDRLEPFVHRMENMYLPFHPSVAGASRAWGGPEGVGAYQEEVDRVARWTRDRGLGLVMITNVVGGDVKADALVQEVRRVAPQTRDLRLTFAEALIAARLKDQLLPFAGISVSVLSTVTNALQALYWQEVAGASFITVAREINRRPDAIRDIRSLGLGIGVVTCDECVPYCPFYRHHLEHDKGPGFVVGGCSPESVGFLSRRPWLIAQKELLPGHLKHLDGLVDEVKIPGRDQTTEKIIGLLGYYLEARSLVHPAGYYEEPPEMWDVLASCDRRCHVCRYCAETIRPRKTKSGAQAVSTSPGRDGDSIEIGEDQDFLESIAAVPWCFRDAAGGVVEIWLEPAGDHHALYTVSGISVYYRCPAGEHPGAAALVVAVGEALESGAADGRDPQKVRLPTTGWPGGFERFD